MLAVLNNYSFWYCRYVGIVTLRNGRGRYPEAGDSKLRCWRLFVFYCHYFYYKLVTFSFRSRTLFLFPLLSIERWYVGVDVVSTVAVDCRPLYVTYNGSLNNNFIEPHSKWSRQGSAKRNIKRHEYFINGARVQCHPFIGITSRTMFTGLPALWSC